MKNPWVIIAIITVVLFGGAVLISSTSSNSSNESVEIVQHIKGNNDSSIKLVEYSDFQCPACGAFQPVVKEIMEEYGESLSFEYKHFPLSTIHPHALSAALAAEAAGQQGKFFEFHDMLFENQTEWSGQGVPSATFVKYAEELGLNMDQFKSQMKSSILRDKIRDEFNEGRGLGITGTPTFFLNGERMQFTTYADFIEQVAVTVDPSSAPTSTQATPPSGSGIKFGL